MIRKAILPVGLVLLIALLAAPLAKSAGLGALVAKARRDFVALRYLESASRAATSRPSDRALARQRILRALELAPSEPTIRAAAPAILAAAGDFAGAERALAGIGNPMPVLYGEVLLAVGKQDDGVRVLLAAARAAQAAFRAGAIGEPEFAMEMNNVGYTLANGGALLKDAKAFLEAATNILPLDPNCADSLGWAYYRLGEYPRAAFYLERAVRHLQPPGAPEVYYHLGAAYARLGRLSEAHQALARALELDPQYPEARHELSTLQWALPNPALASATKGRRI